MEFGLLGPITVLTGSGEVPLGSAKRRTVLASLLLRPNTAVSVGQLTETLWGDEPPEHARTVIQGHVSRLRAVLTASGADAYGIELATLSSAYALRLPEELIDAHRFAELVTLARRQHSAQDAVLLLREALDLWRGPALTGVVTTPSLGAAAHALEQQRLTAVEALGESLCALGEFDRAAQALRAEAVAHPMREALIAALMGALFRSGRQSEAIDWFHRTRRLLADELGIDPGERLRRVYGEILRAEEERAGAEGVAVAVAVAEVGSGEGLAEVGSGGGASGDEVPEVGSRDGVAGGEVTEVRSGGEIAGDAVTEVGSRGGVADVAASYVPREPAAPVVPLARTIPYPLNLLPRLPHPFTGRRAELAVLDRLAGLAEPAPPSPLILLTGPAGSGTSALATYWAHTRADAFPDGVLYADLSTPDAQPPSVLRDFLLTLGVPPDRLPGSVPGAAALLRSLTAGRRLLTVLDGAADSAHVRPLLSAGGGCVTLVTGHVRLDGLIVSENASLLPLPPLPGPDALDLLAALLGPDRTAAEPDATRELALLCDHLPLALRVAATRLRAHPAHPLADLVTELHDASRRLELLSLEDVGVTGALAPALARLSPADADLLRALSTGEARHADPAALDRLAALHLVHRTPEGDRAVPPLVRLHARGPSGAAR
ncbi:AfsR/SARP family transcriptional regulator [Streptantibioticus parmotrematis]|uniref:AfsR/SARP family transcriptional regulator n=1 Tax=Streptantibioticus parmotrematis TaxID=2873249 RepID=UPI0027DEF08E|nr:BTAD domain-containing putative transcriptional regulator [Streptantibioticus parmotrematis]